MNEANPVAGLYGSRLMRCLIIMGWSERELARRIGVPQSRVTRITKSSGSRTLTEGESKALLKLVAFVEENPLPRRTDPLSLGTGPGFQPGL